MSWRVLDLKRLNFTTASTKTAKVASAVFAAVDVTDELMD
jgi:hypothetical protein